MKLAPADLVFNAQEIPYSPIYDDIYHSAAGAWRQAEYVFLRGNQLPLRWAERSQFVILETGFGLGTNFLATWAAWQNDPRRCRVLHFVSIEKHPLRAQDLQQAWLAKLARASADHHQQMSLQEQQRFADQLITQWPMLTPGLHRLVFAQGQVVLTLALGDVADMLPRLHLGVDAFYLDGFAPRKNPEMWSLAVCKGLARVARENATLATYSCAASVRAHLQLAGFVLQKQAGFGDPLSDQVAKREMLIGHFAPRWQVRRFPPPVAFSDTARTAIVIGAGIGGCAVASALARQGWQVTIFDQCAEIAQLTSAHPRAAFHPVLAQDDNVMARAARAGFQLLRRHTGINRCGVLQVAICAEEAEQSQRMLANLDFDPAFARWVNAEEACRLSGVTCDWGGIWFADGGWANMPALCEAYLRVPGIQLQLNTRIHTIARHSEDWCLYTQSGQQLACAPVLILANALDSQRLLCNSGLLGEGADLSRVLPLRQIRGQLSYFQFDQFNLTSVLCGAGYILPIEENRLMVGATYDEGDNDLTIRAVSHQQNLQNLQKLASLMLQDASVQNNLSVTAYGGFVGQRCVALDRLPLIGAWPDILSALKHPQRASAHLKTLPRCSGLYTALALGSRGLIWSALAGEMLSSQIMGLPSPIEADLLNGLDPGRFLLRYLRKI